MKRKPVIFNNSIAAKLKKENANESVLSPIFPAHGRNNSPDQSPIFPVSKQIDDSPVKISNSKIVTLQSLKNAEVQPVLPKKVVIATHSTRSSDFKLGSIGTQSMRNSESQLNSLKVTTTIAGAQSTRNSEPQTGSPSKEESFSFSKGHARNNRSVDLKPLIINHKSTVLASMAQKKSIHSRQLSLSTLKKS